VADTLYTKRKLIELIRREVSGGYPSDIDRVRDAEIEAQICSVANVFMKKEVFTTTMNLEGATIPNGCVLATYKADVSRGVGVTSFASLPITPMYLPNGMGVFSVYPDGFPWKEYIPLPPNVVYTVMRDKMINPINKKCYTIDENQVVIFDDLVGAGITKVGIKLAVMDITKYGLNDVLPIPPEMITDIFTAVVNVYKQEPNKLRTEGNQPQP